MFYLSNYRICLYQASTIAKRSSSGLFNAGGVLADRLPSNETKTIESKTMAMTFTKASPDGRINSFSRLEK